MVEQWKAANAYWQLYYDHCLDRIDEGVNSGEPLSVYICYDLLWNIHVDHNDKKRLYAQRVLKKSVVPHADLAHTYCSLICSVQKKTLSE